MVRKLAVEINMKVNEKKTQVLCIHANKSSEVTSYIRTESGDINSSDQLKILGLDLF